MKNVQCTDEKSFLADLNDSAKEVLYNSTGGHPGEITREGEEIDTVFTTRDTRVELLDRVERNLRSLKSKGKILSKIWGA